MTDNALAVALIGFVVDELEVCPLRAAVPVPVFDLAFACPVIADPPTERAVAPVRNFLSRAHHWIDASPTKVVLCLNAGPYIHTLATNVGYQRCNDLP